MALILFNVILSIGVGLLISRATYGKRYGTPARIALIAAYVFALTMIEKALGFFG